MGMSESKLTELKEKDFDKLLAKHRATWMQMAKDSWEFAKIHVFGGQEPKPDDAWKALLIMLEPNELLQKHQVDNGARFKKYREAFGDYVIDEYMTEQKKKAQKENK